MADLGLNPALASYAADTGPGRFLKGRSGAVLLADLATDGRFTESEGAAAGRAALPGGLFKAAAAAALSRGPLPGPGYCSGSYGDRGRRVPCTLRAGHGGVDLRAAFAQSCDSWFHARLPGREALLSAALELGLVRPQALPALRGAALEDLVAGLAPGLELTPAGLLEAAARWPRTSAWPELRVLLAASAREGAAGGARLPGVIVAGKAGTAPAPDGGGESGWFVGLAPAERPSAAVAAFLRHGQGRDAAALAGDALRWYFRRQGAA